jgi:protein-export membrane protein SecD
MLHFPKWKIVLVTVIAVAGLIYALPNFVPAQTLAGLPGWMPQKQVVLGLDLQGGSHMLLEVDADSVVKDRVASVRDDVRRILREQRVGYRDLRSDGKTVSVRIRDAGDVDKAREALGDLAEPIAGGNLLTGGLITEITIDEPAADRFELTLTEEGIAHRINSAVTQSIEIVRRRIDELGTTEPTIQRQGTDRILVQVPGLQDPQRLKALLGQTAKLTFRLVDQSAVPNDVVNQRPPPGTDLLFSRDDPPVPFFVERSVLVSGENLVDAQPGFDQRTNEPIVTFRFDTQGGRRFALATQANVGRPFAIVLDEEVVSAPVIREPILGGSGQISGGFSVQEANDLAILLRAGALPAKLTIVEERTVGPGLGADSIAAGELAAVVGLAAVVVFMLLAYGLFGIIANIALTANILLLLAVLSVLQATLTLPGIAGIVLTIGMAVDANVLIFERIREELVAGKSAIASIDSGYSRALSTILDANITTFIAAVILFQLGSGPVRGFAITLAIGIVTSVFTAFTLSRLLVSQWVRWRRPSTVPI